MARRPVFLDPAAYRLRRLRDAARLLPVAGGVLLLVPLLWGDDGPSGSRAVVYVFAVWAAMVAVAAWLGPRLDPVEARSREGQRDGGHSDGSPHDAPDSRDGREGP